MNAALAMMVRDIDLQSRTRKNPERTDITSAVGLLSCNWFQLLGGILLAVFLPALARQHFNPEDFGNHSVNFTMSGSIVAITVGFYFYRRLTLFPGVKATSYIALAFMVCFGVIAAGFLLSRIDYSRYQFVMSLVLSILWFHGMHFAQRRFKRLRLAFVPGGGVSSLREIGGVEWIELSRPDQHVQSVNGLVADLRVNFSPEWEHFIAEAAVSGMPVFHSKQVRESLTGRVQIETLSENNFGSLIPGLGYVRIKMIIDWFAAVLLAPVLLPFMFVIAMLIRIESPGPIIFRQQRMGYRGKTFTMYKFRTMVHAGANDVSNADAREAAMTKDGDARITRIGRWLRHLRFDEFPQIINILRCEMSWIGPRPEAVPLSKWYENELSFYRYRHIVRPGITGWAQVQQGHVARVDDVLEKLHYDFFYIKNVSPWLDVLIAIRTMRTMLGGFGAR